MDMTHLHGFIDGMMQRKDVEAMLPHMADDMILKTPLAAEPFKGKAAIRPVVIALMGVVDRFSFREIMQGPQHVCVSFGLTVGSAELDGMDYIRLNEAGLVQEMMVLWRPLPAIVAALNQLNLAAGEPALELVAVNGG
jgi:SnoaL-like domain